VLDQQPDDVEVALRSCRKKSRKKVTEKLTEKLTEKVTCRLFKKLAEAYL
jgi:hypothetical protein